MKIVTVSLIEKDREGEEGGKEKRGDREEEGVREGGRKIVRGRQER